MIIIIINFCTISADYIWAVDLWVWYFEMKFSSLLGVVLWWDAILGLKSTKYVGQYHFKDKTRRQNTVAGNARCALMHNRYAARFLVQWARLLNYQTKGLPMTSIPNIFNTTTSVSLPSARIILGPTLSLSGANSSTKTYIEIMTILTGK